MSNGSATKLTWLDRLVDRFIPPSIAEHREQRQRARMFLISHLCGPFIGSVVPITLFFLDPTPGYPTAVLAASIFAFWLFPPILKAVGRYNLLAFLSIQNLIFCILWSCWFYGGVSSPTLAWVLNIPLIAFMYLGQSRTLRLMFLGQFAVSFIVFGALNVVIPHFPDDTPLLALQGLGVISTLGAAGYCAMMALYYAKILASGVELETEMRGHLATAAELRRATAEAERASTAKAEFLANVSHELRTPLNAVIGYSQILLEDAQDDGDEASAKDLTRIHDAGQHLLRLVNEVLDLSKIEAGKMELVLEDFDITTLVGEVVDAYAAGAKAGGNMIFMDVKRHPGPMTADRRKLSQALSQIVDNAVKFTADGRIAVEIEELQGASRGKVALRVRDTGVGISPESLAGLFENFSGGEDASASKYGGTGLGLALSQRLARLMGGDILVESIPGEGSCFSMILPVRQIAESAPDASADAISALEIAA